MAFSPQQTAILNDASRASIEESLSQIKAYWLQSRWLGAANKYRVDCVNKVSDDVRNSAVNEKHLREYIAASCVTHCFDGWSYLGRALEAELAGDPNASRHLAYYAELRAAMSLLATEGIGVFDKTNIVVDQNGRCTGINDRGTHVFTWKALKWWAGTAKGVSALQNAIHPGGVSLRDWLSYYPGGANFIATHWLTQWGLDLERFSSDKNARHLSSYRPTAFTNPGPAPVQHTLKLVTELWAVCEPGGTGGFPVLDRHLLRNGIESVFKSKYSQSPKKDPTRYRQDVSAMLKSVSPSGLSRAQWEAFLTYKIEPDAPSIVRDAGRKAPHNTVRHSRQMISRATLLLRVATGSTAELLTQVISPSDSGLEFWWSNSAVRRRLWSGSSQPARFSELWQDIEESTASVNAWLSNASNPCCSSAWSQRSKELAILSTTERTALWGLKL